ncbi:hypothetical protein PEL8287_02978 [Roseovarius litorisediminis]|uniref:Uncharacterized protein n=1 Tax=Roseovarius litorisediminis TaxID=1312363 RepID=A0A1Y5T4M3_9RHOB|nr:hypothetical protein [Roseovarius litorisediminis]SLN55696.1 hypothetical protein PEL8287_02978 [Roseovarius litorisediminis]
MKFALNLTVAAALSVTGTQYAYSGGEEKSVWDDCRATNRCTLEYDYLANQETDPFLFNGREINEKHPRWHQFQEAVEEYTHTRQCLVPTEQGKDKPNLLLLDEHAIGTGRGAEVCIYRIMRSLNDVNRIEAWLTYHDFKFGEKRWVVDENYIPRFKTKAVSKITAWWTIERYREVNPSWLAQLTGIDLILNYQVVVGFSREDKVRGVRVVTPSK